MSGAAVTKVGLWKKALIAVLPIALFVWGVSTSWELNSLYPREEWRSDLRADAAGYYVYLPGLFQYGFDGSRMDPELPHAVGSGFWIEGTSHRIRTKYLYGTALLELPFYLAAETAAGWGTTDGFADEHRRGIEAAAVFYWVAGLCFLGLALARWRPSPFWAVLLTIACISFGTNVVYYALRQPAYSHIYSFFLVCVAVWALVTGLLEGGSPARRWAFYASCSLILMVRPIDLIAVGALYLWLYFKHRPVLMRPRFWVEQACVFGLVLLPQVLYWKTAFGTWVADSYGDEGFSHWYAPRVLKVLFAAMNGLLPYAPVLLLVPLGLWVLWREDRRLAWLFAGIWPVVVYTCAAWWAWDFGCSFGCRPATQYMPFAAFAIFPFFTRTDERAVRWRFALVPILALVVFAHFRAAMQVIPCFAGEGPWDYDWFAANYVKAFLGKAH
jgi:hypothetical protein